MRRAYRIGFASGPLRPPRTVYANSFHLLASTTTSVISIITITTINHCCIQVLKFFVGTELIKTTAAAVEQCLDRFIIIRRIWYWIGINVVLVAVTGGGADGQRRLAWRFRSGGLLHFDCL